MIRNNFGMNDYWDSEFSTSKIKSSEPLKNSVSIKID